MSAGVGRRVRARLARLRRPPRRHAQEHHPHPRHAGLWKSAHTAHGLLKKRARERGRREVLCQVDGASAFSDDDAEGFVFLYSPSFLPSNVSLALDESFGISNQSRGATFAYTHTSSRRQSLFFFQARGRAVWSRRSRARLERDRARASLSRERARAREREREVSCHAFAASAYARDF